MLFSCSVSRLTKEEYLRDDQFRSPQFKEKTDEMLTCWVTKKLIFFVIMAEKYLTIETKF
jgi:hypothetical protein